MAQGQLPVHWVQVEAYLKKHLADLAAPEVSYSLSVLPVVLILLTGLVNLQSWRQRGGWWPTCMLLPLSQDGTVRLNLP